jgi:hypothetical protein
MTGNTDIARISGQGGAAFWVPLVGVGSLDDATDQSQPADHYPDSINQLDAEDCGFQ